MSTSCICRHCGKQRSTVASASAATDTAGPDASGHRALVRTSSYGIPGNLLPLPKPPMLTVLPGGGNRAGSL